MDHCIGAAATSCSWLERTQQPIRSLKDSLLRCSDDGETKKRVGAHFAPQTHNRLGVNSCALFSICRPSQTAKRRWRATSAACLWPPATVASINYSVRPLFSWPSRADDPKGRPWRALRGATLICLMRRARCNSARLLWPAASGACVPPLRRPSALWPALI